MKHRLTHAISVGLSLAGCSGRAISDGQSDGGADGTGSTSGGTQDGSASMTASATGTVTSASGEGEGEAEAEADDGSESDDGVRFDVAPERDVSIEPEPLGCEDPPPPFATCAVGPPDDYVEWVTVCLPLGETGSCPEPQSGDVVLAIEDCIDSTVWKAEGCGGSSSACSPVVVDDACCYWAPFTGYVCPGRPFLVEGRERTASFVEREDWCAPWPGMSRCDAALAQAWLFDARNEHAAIASFSRFALQLLALAAPPRFVAAALQAAADEREHATLFFGLARAHGCAAIGPGPLDISGALDGGDDPIAIVVATVREGCIAETISALQLERACEHAEDPRLREALAHVLDEEHRHVELAWSFVAWAYARGDARLRAAVGDAFAEAERWIPRGPDVEPAHAEHEQWRRAGRLPRAEAHAIALHTIRDVIGPAARELCASPRTRRPAPAPHPTSAGA